MRKIFALGIGLVSIFCAAPALALETGQCLSMAAMNEAMKSAGQRSLIVGDWVDYDGQLVPVAGTSMTRAEWVHVQKEIQYDSGYRRDLVAKLTSNGRSQDQIEDFMAKLRDTSAIAAKGDPGAPVPRHMMVFASNEDGSVGYVVVGNRPSAEASSQACVRAQFRNLRLANKTVLNARAPSNGDLLTARGDVVQTNGVKVSDVAIALRGSTATGEGQLVVLQTGNAPLFILKNISLRPAAMERAKP